MANGSQRTICISGATSGIGSFLAHYFARNNFRLVLLARNKDKLDDLIKALPAGLAFGFLADLAKPYEVEAMFSKIEHSVGAIDALINNAFGKLESELTETTGEELQDFFAVSVAGNANVTRLAIPLLLKAEVGRVVNIVADWGFPMHNIMTGPSPYISAKYAIHGLGAALQTELARHGIRTTNLCPGIVAASVPFGEIDGNYNDGEPLKAIHPIDVAKAIDFVLSQDFCHVKSIVLSPRNPEYNGL